MFKESAKIVLQTMVCKSISVVLKSQNQKAYKLACANRFLKQFQSILA